MFATSIQSLNKPSGKSLAELFIRGVIGHISEQARQQEKGHTEVFQRNVVVNLHRLPLCECQSAVITHPSLNTLHRHLTAESKTEKVPAEKKYILGVSVSSSFSCGI